MKAGFLWMSGRRKAGGFTLIELLVTIAVIAILVSVGVPAYNTFTRGSALSGASTELVAALNEARSRAVAERRSMRLEQISGTDPDGAWINGWRLVRVVDDAVLQVVDRRQRSQGITVDEASDLPGLVFDKEGRPDSAASFAICDPGQKGESGRTIGVTSFGRVSTAPLVCP